MMLYRHIVVGKGGVGKTALMNQFVQRRFFGDGYWPMEEDTYRKQVEIDDEMYLLDIVETECQEEIQGLDLKGEGFLIVYSITNRESFEQVTREIEKIQKMKEKEDFPMVIVGNKIDLEKDRKISQNEAMDLAKTYNCPFFETSAKNNHNVQEAFYQLVREVNLYNSKNNIKKNQSQNENQKTYKCTIF
ncbi:ras-like protein [Anaeramoeba flamelloides]|uniref:Ras-like protein n=1 Tax=Anaeramoeba flamelloides TaxID=1746091 RepID=A0AAV7Z5R2_9EUKA|nr:ras-like protein [Anaeramoeba flamelloides]